MRLIALALFLSILAVPASAQETPQQTTLDAAQAPAAVPEQAIALSSPDGEINKRLRGLFTQIDGLDQVQVGVRDGIVTLSGTVLTTEDRRKAEAVASRLVGVVSVQNRIEIEHRVGRRVAPMIARANAMVQDLLAFVPLLGLALLIFAGFWLLGRLASRSTRVFGKMAPNPLVQTLVAQIVQLIFLLLGLIVAMRIIGATALLGSVLGAAGVFGLAIGFAVRDTIENYIASILLSIRRPFSPNDHVIIEGMEGRVTRLNSRATFLTSFDGNELRIPNSIVYKAKITNFSQIPQRRFEFFVGIGYDDDLCRALTVALDALRSSSGVMADPEPTVLVDSLAESTVSLKMMGWVDLKKSDFWKVRSEAIRSLKTAFDDQSISMPAPIQLIQAIDQPTTPEAPNRPAQPVASDAIGDTRADRTIEHKVDDLRSKGSEDLLTTEAPRE